MSKMQLERGNLLQFIMQDMPYFFVRMAAYGELSFAIILFMLISHSLLLKATRAYPLLAS